MMNTHSRLKHNAPEFSPNSRASLNPDAAEFTASPHRGRMQQSQQPNYSHLNPLSVPFNPNMASPMKQRQRQQQQQPVQMMQQVVPPQPRIVLPQPDFRHAANNYTAPLMMPLPPAVPAQQPRMMPVDGPTPLPPGAGFDSYDVYDEYSAFNTSQNGAMNGEDVDIAAGPPQAPQQLQQAAPPPILSKGPVPRPPIPPRPQPPGANGHGNGSGHDDYQSNELQQRVNWQEEKLDEYAKLLQSRDDQIRELEEDKLRVELKYDELCSRYSQLRDEYKKQTRRYQEELTAVRYDNHRSRQQRQYQQQYAQQQTYESPERPSGSRGDGNRSRQSNGHHMSNGYSVFASDLSEYGHGPAQLSPTRHKPSRAQHNPSPARSAGSATGTRGSYGNVVTAIKNFRATQPEELDLVALEEYYVVKTGVTTGSDSMVEVTSKSGKTGWVPATHLTPV